MLAQKNVIPQVLGLGIWFFVSSTLIFALGADGAKEFDPNLEMSSALMDIEYEQKVIAAVREIKASGSILVHVRPEGYCFCDFLASEHRNALNAATNGTNIQNVNVTLNEIDALRRLLPRTPSVVLVDESNMLRFIGPYSVGMGCFSSSGKIDLALDKLINAMRSSPKATRTESPMIISDARGCYC